LLKKKTKSIFSDALQETKIVFELERSQRKRSISFAFTSMHEPTFSRRQLWQRSSNNKNLNIFSLIRDILHVFTNNSHPFLLLETSFTFKKGIGIDKTDAF